MPMLFKSDVFIRLLLLSGLSAIFFSCSQPKAPGVSMRDYTNVQNLIVSEFRKADLPAKVVSSGVISVGDWSVKLDVSENLSDGLPYQTSVSGKNITIQARTAELLTDATYHLLRKLGVRSLLPGKKWEIYPSLAPEDLSSGELTGTTQFPYASLFSSRSVFKSEEYQEWLRRNGVYSASAVELGHYGRKFNQKYRQVISQHPEWFPVINGVRSSFSGNMKLDYTHPEVVALFQQDAAEKLQALIAAGVRPPYFLSVEPPDGKGFTEDPYVSGADPSHQVFALANAVAEHLSDFHPAAYVSVLAYTVHSTPPGFTMHPKVAVIPVTGWFQETASTNGLLAMWAQQGAYRGIRTYAGVPKNTALQVQLPLDEPDPDLYQAGGKYGYTIYREQTVFASGGLGLRHYLTAALLNNPSVDLNKEKTTFFNLAFGAAAGAIRRMYEQCWVDYNHKTDFPFIVETLRNASEATRGNTDVQARLTDLMAYAVYLDMAHEIKRKDQYAAMQSLSDFAYSIASRHVVNAEHLTRHYNNMLRKNGPKLRVLKPQELPAQLSESQVRQMFDAIAQSPQNKTTPALQRGAYGRSMVSAKKTNGEDPLLLLRGQASFILEDRNMDGRIEIQLQTKHSNKESLFTALDWFTTSGTLIQSHRIDKATKQGKVLSVAVPKGDRVELHIYGRGSRFGLRINEEVISTEGKNLRVDGTFNGTLFIPPGENRGLKANNDTDIVIAKDNNTYQLKAGSFVWLDDISNGNSLVELNGVNSTLNTVNIPALYFHR